MSLATALAHRATSAWRDFRGERAVPARRHRWTLGRSTLILAVAAWLATFGNLPFWRSVLEITSGLSADNLLFLPSLALCVGAWIYLLLSLIAWGRATQAALVGVLVVSAAAGYFMETYGVLLDRSMIANVVQTHAAEALDLVTWRLGAWLLAFGVFPAILVGRVRVTRRKWTRELGTKAMSMGMAAACLATLLLIHYQHFASLLRNHPELRYMLVPHNIASALHGHFKRALAAPIVLETVGADASRAIPVAGRDKPMLLVLVIGETARADNFSLNGYKRNTNPELTQRNVLSYSDVSACGTSTAASLPCMFLDAGRAGFHETLVQRREGLLDVLQHAGIAVHWLDNNSGCKGVCDRLPREKLPHPQGSSLCRDGECYDEILLHGLQARIDKLDHDTVIVMHMMGSHGPAYYKRYPAQFEVYTPACNTTQLDRCEKQHIVNAYDNTLRYTDHVLAQTIDLLQHNAPRFDTAMLYVSDHGESLGEKGLYLHGVPYALAPREQLHVPLLLWFSEGLRKQMNIDVACLKSKLGEPLSHDYIYHSVLGLSGVRTALYRP